MPYKKISGVYRILNTKNNKSYIGSSISVYNRLSTHKRQLIQNKHFNKHLQSSFNIYGIDSFSFSLLEETEVDIISEREEYYISFYNSNNNDFGYNKRIHCDTNIGRKFSNTHIENLKKSHIGIKRTEESNLRIIRSQYKPIYKIDRKGLILHKYDSILLASIENKLHKSSISACCRGKLNSTGGFHWCFVDKFDEYIFKKIAKVSSRKRIIFVYENTKTGEIHHKLKDVSDSLKIKCTTLHNMFSGVNKNSTDFIRYERN